MRCQEFVGSASVLKLSLGKQGYKHDATDSSIVHDHSDVRPSVLDTGEFLECWTGLYANVFLELPFVLHVDDLSPLFTFTFFQHAYTSTPYPCVSIDHLSVENVFCGFRIDGQQ